jgi:hypothetical protein
VWRAGIILATADGFGTAGIMRRTGKSKPCVWRWQARFMTEGVRGGSGILNRGSEWLSGLKSARRLLRNEERP